MDDTVVQNIKESNVTYVDWNFPHDIIADIYICFRTITPEGPGMSITAPLPPLLLPPNTKGWLSGPQKQFVEAAYLPEFINRCVVDPAGAKEWATTAALTLIKTFGWHRPFNVAPEPVVEEGELSAEDK